MLSAMSDPAAVLNSLLRVATIEDHDQILQAANAALKVSKTNLEVQHTRVVALLKLDRFGDALRAIEGGDRLEEQCGLEKAYALYKTGQLDAAHKLLDGLSVSSASRGFRHLTAQVAYRAERFEDAAAIYRDMATGEGVVGEENDLRINTLATHAQMEWRGQGCLLDYRNRQPQREDLEAFETAYNAACGCVARGDFNKASVLLKRSRDLCEASDELTEEEKKAELLPIMVQHAYVSTRLGKETDAAALQKLIVPAEISEAATKTVALNNQLAAGSKARNPYVTQRLYESVTVSSGNDQLFEYQSSAFRRNDYALKLQTQHFDGILRRTSRTIAKATTPTVSREIVDLGVISAAAAARSKTGKEAITQILPMLKKRPTDLGLLMTIIQLYVQADDPGRALNLLVIFFRRIAAATTPDHDDVRFAPGLVALTVSLYRKMGRNRDVKRELSRAARHWRTKPELADTTLLREAGVELLHSSTPENMALAGSTFESLVAQSEEDHLAKAGLVASFATTDYAKIQPYVQGLTPVDTLIAGTDVGSLIKAGVASAAPAAPPPQQGKKRAAENNGPDEQQKPAKRRRKPRLPKNMEEGKIPDPERWLPLRDRSSYRPKGRKGKRRAQEATQGGAVKQEETLELVGGVGAVKVERATGAGGKKRKKGKK